jgi:hypothetical protein
VSFDSKLIAVERDFKVFPPVKTDGARQMFKNPLTLDSVWTSHRTMLPSPLNPTSHSDISYIIWSSVANPTVNPTVKIARAAGGRYHFMCLRDCSPSMQISSINSASTRIRSFKVTVQGLV